MSCYLHQLPGRIRIKTALLKGKPHLAQIVEEKLRTLSGICSVTINPKTGSILINYNEDEVKSAAILCTIEKQCGLDLSAARSEGPVSQESSKTRDKIAERVGRVVLSMFFNQVFEGTPLAVISAVI